MHSRWWLVAQASVSIALLALVLINLDQAAFRALVVRVPASFYAASLAVVLAGQIAYAWRWQLLLTSAGLTVRFIDVARQYFIGIFVNNFLPSTVGGDMAKVYYLGRQHGYRAVAASVAVDRILGVGLLAALAATALWFNPIGAPAFLVAQGACAAIAIAATVVLVVTSTGAGGLQSHVRRFGNRAVRYAGHLRDLRIDMAAPLARPAVIVQAAAVVVGYAAAVALLYVRFIELHSGAAPPYAAVFAVVSATTVLSNLPISLNGLGLREQLHVSLFAPLDVSSEVAVAMSLLLYAHLIVASLIGLIFWLRAPAALAVTSPGA